MDPLLSLFLIHLVYGIFNQASTVLAHGEWDQFLVTIRESIYLIVVDLDAELFNMRNIVALIEQVIPRSIAIIPVIIMRNHNIWQMLLFIICWLGVNISYRFYFISIAMRAVSLHGLYAVIAANAILSLPVYVFYSVNSTIKYTLLTGVYLWLVTDLGRPVLFTILYEIGRTILGV